MNIESARSTLWPQAILRAQVLAASAALILLTGCTNVAASTTPTVDESASPGAAVTLPPENATPDYQLGGAYPPADGVDVVARDRADPPAEGMYSICYVNGFQTQPGELGDWPIGTLLHHNGEPMIDPDWPDEVLLDTSTAESRRQILDLVSPWIIGCAEAGYDAVEFDNLDSYTRSHDAMSLEDNLMLAGELVTVAHNAGLAAGQKNAAEDTVALHERAGFDFAITEECAAYRECAAYTSVYGPHVIDIEYTTDAQRSFQELCAQTGSPPAMVHRDRNLSLPGDPDYVFETCDEAP